MACMDGEHDHKIKDGIHFGELIELEDDF